MQKFFYLVDILIVFVWAAVVFALWNYLRPFELWEPFTVAVVFFISVLIQLNRVKPKKLNVEKLHFFAETNQKFQDELESSKVFWRGAFFARISGFFIPLLLAVVFFYLEPVRQDNFIARVKSIFEQFTGTAELFVTTSDASQKEIKYELNRKKKITVTLKGQNLVRVSIATFTQIDPPAVLLKPVRQGAAPVTFAMTSVQKNGVADHDSQYEAVFAVTEQSELWISSISPKNSLAILMVEDEPKIQVTLNTDLETNLALLDTNQIPLTIKATSDFAIDLIELKIAMGDQVFKQKIMDVIEANKTNITTNYNFLPEPYMTDDEAELTIQAQVWDKKQPSPRSGLSAPITLKIQSAYGRYIALLSQLSEVNQLMTEAIEESSKKADLDKKIEQKLSEAVALSADSVFFDALDRMELDRILQKWTEYTNSSEKSKQNIFEIKDELSRFLSEHEALNDQERDLDFFVAVKQISRTLMAQKWKASEKNLGRLKKFVEERGKRWQVRVDRLPRDMSSKFASVTQKVQEILKHLDSVREHAESEQFDESKEKLNVASDVYRTWIDSLVKAEEEFKKKTEKEKNKALTQGRDEIKILRKAQAEISTRLDHKNPSEIKLTEKTWPAVRSLQAKNKVAAVALSKKMEGVSILASKRLLGASEFMDLTIRQGDGRKELEAENASDSAARLLIIADQAAAEEQGRTKRERGRRKRLTGNNYFGQAISGGNVDFTRNYEVDRKFREDILEHIDSSQLDETERKVLDDYVRDVVR